MEYVALPEQIYNQILRYLGGQPYDVMKDFIPAIQQSARFVEQIISEPDPLSVKATETATGDSNIGD